MNETLIEKIMDLAQQPGMTYTKLANKLDLEKSRVREICIENGIKLGNPMQKEITPVADQDDTKEMLVCMVEDIKQLKGEVKELEAKITLNIKAFSKALDKIKVPGSVAETTLSFIEEMQRLAAELDKYEGHISLVGADDYKVIQAMGTIFRAALKSDFQKINNQIDRHHHIGLSIEQSKEFRGKLYAERETYQGEEIKVLKQNVRFNAR